MRRILSNLLNVEEEELNEVLLLLLQGFLLGLFVATYKIGTQTMFLGAFDEKKDLPFAIIISGVVGIVITYIFAFFQSRIPFSYLSFFTLLFIIVSVVYIRGTFGEISVASLKANKDLIFAAFVLSSSFEALGFLIFWGLVGRMFHLKQQKRILGSIDLGKAIATLIAFFAIPILLSILTNVADLLYVSILGGSLLLFNTIWIVYISKNLGFLVQRLKRGEVAKNQRFGLFRMIRTPYTFWVINLTIFAIMGSVFIDYSFVNTLTVRYPQDKDLASFLGYYQGGITILAVVLQTFVADLITNNYGIKTTLLINPILLGLFTTLAVVVGTFMGFAPTDSSFLFFFISIAMGKMFTESLKDAFDEPTMKLYLLPIDSKYRLDVVARLDGVVKVGGGLIAGLLLITIDYFKVFNLLSFSVFLIPIVIIWVLLIFQVHTSYKVTLKNTLNTNQKQMKKVSDEKYGVDRILQTELEGNNPYKSVYVLKLMEKIEPLLYEEAMKDSQKFTDEKIQEYLFHARRNLKLQEKQLLGTLKSSKKGDGNGYNIEDLNRMSKSFDVDDRLRACGLLSKYISDENLYILINLLRDADSQVRLAALHTARKIRRPELISILIEMLASPLLSHLAMAYLIEEGEKILPNLESAFYKSGQELVIQKKIVQIYKRNGSKEAIRLLWKKIDYPERDIVEEVMLAFSYCNIEIPSEHFIIVDYILDVEMRDAAWDVAALLEIENVDYTEPLRNSLIEEIKYNYDKIFDLLALMYDEQSIQLVRDNVESDSSEGKVFAIELLDVFVSENIKKKLFPLIDEIDLDKKSDILEYYYPRLKLNPVDVLKYLTVRDYNYTNNWTRCCAMISLAKTPEIGGLDELVTNLFHSDEMLMETAAWAIYKKDKELLYKVMPRLKEKSQLHIKNVVIPSFNTRMDKLFPLRFDKIQFMQSVDFLENVQGDIMSVIVEGAIEVNFHRDQIIIQRGQSEVPPVYIVVKGRVRYNYGERELIIRERQVFAEQLVNDFDNYEVEAVALQDTIVLAIDKMFLYELMIKNYHFAKTYIRNVSQNFENMIVA